MAHVLVLACIRHSVMPSPTTATWRFVEDATVRLRVDMSSGTVRYTAHCGIWWVRLLVCSCVASFVRVFVRLFVFLPLFVCRYSFVVRSLAFGMLFVVRAFWQSAGPPGLIPARRPRHARHCCDIGMYWSLCPAIPHDCDCVRSGDLLFEILSCPTVWIHADMRVVRGASRYDAVWHMAEYCGPASEIEKPFSRSAMHVV